MAIEQQDDGSWRLDAPGIRAIGLDREMAEALDADAAKLASFYEEGDRVTHVGEGTVGTVCDVGDGSSIGVAWDDWDGELGYEDPFDIAPGEIS